MLRSILSSFARSFGRGLGYRAARSLSWLAIPLVIIVVIVGVIELLSGGELSRLALPIVPTLMPWQALGGGR